MRLLSLRFFLCALACLWAFSATTHAGTFTYNGPAIADGATVNVKAVFTTTGGVTTVDIYNYTTTANTISVSEIITGFKFTVSGGEVASGLAAGQSGGQPLGHVYLTGSSPYTVAASTASIVSSTQWTMSSSPGNAALTVLSGSMPDYGIIGPGSSVGAGQVTYSSANASLKNMPHNPFVYQQAEFTLSGINADQITGMQFQFGTNAASGFIPGVPNTGQVPPAPEPASMTLLAFGVLGMAGYRVRKWRKGLAAA